MSEGEGDQVLQPSYIPESSPDSSGTENPENIDPLLDRGRVLRRIESTGGIDKKVQSEKVPSRQTLWTQISIGEASDLGLQGGKL